MANTVDSDETAHYEPSHLDLQCLQIQLLLCLALYRLTCLEAPHRDTSNEYPKLFSWISVFLKCFQMDYRDFSVKSKVIISLFQTVRLSLSIFTVCKFVLSPIKYN